MLLRSHTGVILLAIGGMLLAGCSSTPHSAAPNPPGAATTKATTNEVDPKLVSAHAHYALGMIYDAADRPEDALKELGEAAKNDPANEDLVLELSRRYLAQKEPERALELLQLAAAVPQASGAIFARLAAVYDRLGKDDQALAAGQTAIKRAPLLPVGYLTLMVLELKKGRGAQAAAVLETAARQPNASVEFLVELAGMYATLERSAPSQREVARAGARSILARVEQFHPANPQILLRVADGLNLAGDTTNATRIYLQLLRRPDDLPGLEPEIRGKLAELYIDNHAPEKASEQLEAIVRQDPTNPKVYSLLGSLAYDARKLPEAEDYFTKSLLLAPDDEEVYYGLATVQVNLDKVPAAVKTLQTARTKFGETFRGEFLLGMASSRATNFTDATRHFTSAELLAREADPKALTPYFYYEAGSACERKGDYEEAERYFEKALKLDPAFAEALNYYGYMLADRGVKLDHARELIEQAVKLEPKNSAYLDSLAWVLYKLKQPAAALPQQLKAVEFSEKPDATLYDHLGDIYTALKQPEQAREAWRKSVAVEPNAAVQKKLGLPAGE